MKNTHRKPFYLPNPDADSYEDKIFDPEDNLYNNPDDDSCPGFTMSTAKNKTLKKREKDSFDEI